MSLKLENSVYLLIKFYENLLWLLLLEIVQYSFFSDMINDEAWIEEFFLNSLCE